jgi:hypothetical protein
MKLSEDTQEMIQGLASQIDWEKVAKGPDKDKVVQAFADKVVASCDDSEKDEAEKVAREEAEAACMNANIDSGAVTASKELEKYMKDKSQKITEAEEAVSSALSGVPEITNETPEVTPETSVTGMNGNIMGDYGEDNQYIADPVSDTGILSDDTLDDMSDEEIADTVNREYMETPMVVTGGVQSDNIAAPETEAPAEPTDDDILSDVSEEDLNAEIDSDLNDVDFSDVLTPDEEETLYSLFNKIADAASNGNDFATKIENETGVSSEEAQQIAASTEAATIAAVKAQQDSGATDTATTPETAEPTEPETNPISFNFDAKNVDNDNDEIDQTIEDAIDDYEAQGDYSDEDLYEALCYKFDITDSKELLAENNGCVPDAILGISKILHERLA